MVRKRKSTEKKSKINRKIKANCVSVFFANQIFNQKATYQAIIALFLAFFVCMTFVDKHSLGYSLSKTNYKTSPKKANIFLSWTISDSEANELAKWDLLVLDMETQLKSRDQLKKIKQINPQIILLAYITPQEIRDDAPNCFSEMRRKLAQNISPAWYLVDSYGSKYSFWPGTHMLNVTDYSPLVNSQRFNQMLPQFVSNEILNTGLWDGVFYDNAWEGVTWFTGNNLDYNQDGVAESDLDNKWRQGMRAIYDETRRLTDDKYLIIGNGINKVYRDELNGILLESFNSNNLSWSQSMEIYDYNQSAGPTPRITLINSNVGNSGKKNSYRSMRFGLTSALMSDGYYSFDDGDKTHAQLWWYDEYDARLGKSTATAISANGYNKFKEDVWRRDFDFGLALVNPTKQSQTVILASDYEKISGKQDTQVNDGAIVDRVTLGANDGMVLLKSIQQTKDLVNLTFNNGAFLRFFSVKGNRVRNGFFAFDTAQPSGAKLFTGDLNGDGDKEQIMTHGAKFEIFNSRGERWFTENPFGGNFKGEMRFAVGANPGEKESFIVLSGNYGNKIVVYDYHGEQSAELTPFNKYNSGFSVAAGNVDGLGQTEVVVGVGKEKKCEVLIYDSKLLNLKKRFAVENKSCSRGVSVGAGDMNGDGVDEIVTAINYHNKAVIRLFNYTGSKLSEFEITSSFGSINDVELATMDANNDGIKELAIMTR